MEADAVKMFDPLYDLAVQLRDQHESFVHSDAFLADCRRGICPAFDRGTREAGKYRPGKDSAGRALASEHRTMVRSYRRRGIAIADDPSILGFVFKRDYDKRAGLHRHVISGKQNTGGCAKGF